jgi:hypothetical protein
MKNIILLLSIIVLVGCNPKEEEEPENTAAYITEFTVNGKTYNIGTTGYSTILNALFTVEGQKGNLEMNFSDELKLGTYKFTDGYILIGHESFSGSFQAVYDKVDVTISKIGTVTSYGTANIQGTFSGTFLYMETDSNGVLSGGSEVQLSGKFSTTP